MGENNQAAVIASSGSASPATPSEQTGIAKIIARGFAAVVAYFATLFCLTWTFSSIGSLSLGTGRDLVAGFIGLFFAALAGLIAFICLRKVFGYGPLLKRAPTQADIFSNPMQFTEKHEIKAITSRIWAQAGSGLGLLSTAIPFWITGTPRAIIYGIFFTFVGFLLLGVALRRFASGNVTFTYDSQGVTIPGIFGNKYWEWREVEDIQLMKRTIYLYHFIPLRSVYHVYLKVSGRLFGTRKIYLPLSQTGMTKEEMAVLTINLQRQRSFGLGDVHVAQTHHARAGATAVSTSGFGRRTF